MRIIAKRQAADISVAEHLKEPRDVAASKLVTVSFSTACFCVVYLIDTAIIQPRNRDGFFWIWCKHYAIEIAALACCIVALAAPRLVKSWLCSSLRTLFSRQSTHVCSTPPDHFHSRGARQRSRVPITEWYAAFDEAAKAADPDMAERLFAEMQLAGAQPNAVIFNALINACARKSHLKRAENWLRRMKAAGVKRNVVTYNTLIDTCSKVKDAESTEAIFYRMYEDGVEGNVVSFAMVIHSRAKCGDGRRAEEWLRKMKDFHVEPNVVIYNSLINASGRKGHVEIAEGWFEEMLVKGIEPLVTSYAAVVGACAKASDLYGAEKWMEKMLVANIKPNAFSFGAMFDACAKACDPVRAEYWHVEMVDAGVEPHPHTYVLVVNAFAKTGDAVAAEKWLRRMEDAGSYGSGDVVPYCSVLAACAKANDPKHAMAIFRQMQQKGIRPDIVAYSSLALSFANRGDWQQVELLLLDMTTDGIAMSDYFLYALLLAYASATPKQGRRAETAIREAVRKGIQINDQLVAGLSRALGRPAAEALLRELAHGDDDQPHVPRRRCRNKATWLGP